ncbi:hypothetical protein [Aeromonas salmonicida]|uniref:hypothetical protein n=1 Tax=Aeromonas salmonicida TaxID=645 RepID=UPI001F33C3EB|nr:hypothetical protein [Aeromonas salmonicida]MCE9935508.1 hypothetical protein [Aeromonas salmonicida]
MNMNSQVGISEDQLANRSECIMTIRLFSRAAKRADQIVTAIADRLNGNAARRRAIKQRLHLAMMATEQHHIVAARAAQKRTAGFTTSNNLLKWRAELHRAAV